jgi:hypothetical protein
MRKQKRQLLDTLKIINQTTEQTRMLFVPKQRVHSGRIPDHRDWPNIERVSVRWKGETNQRLTPGSLESESNVVGNPLVLPLTLSIPYFLPPSLSFSYVSIHRPLTYLFSLVLPLALAVTSETVWQGPGLCSVGTKWEESFWIRTCLTKIVQKCPLTSEFKMKSWNIVSQQVFNPFVMTSTSHIISCMDSVSNNSVWFLIDYLISVPHTCNYL